jgi:uncharacterized CHY-type Zn-finger protein
MCRELNESYRCIDCDEEIERRRDFTMCKKGREANEWGACKKGVIEQKVFRQKRCDACEKKKNDK